MIVLICSLIFIVTSNYMCFFSLTLFSIYPLIATALACFLHALAAILASNSERLCKFILCKYIVCYSYLSMSGLYFCIVFFVYSNNIVVFLIFEFYHICICFYW